jgi:predicted small integral membrane protein
MTFKQFYLLGSILSLILYFLATVKLYCNVYKEDANIKHFVQLRIKMYKSFPLEFKMLCIVNPILLVTLGPIGIIVVLIVENMVCKEW